MTGAAPLDPVPGIPGGTLRLLSDERLAQRAAQGDQRAFEAIYRRFHQDLYRFCLAMVGSPQDAQDALQNTMVKVLRALPGEKREIQLKPWLYRIARNESVETLRRRRDSAELEPQQAAIAGVSETAETREHLRTLLADLEQLPERQRATLVMRELSGLDFAQIGAAFGTSPAVARQTLYEARLSLRQLEAGREMRCADVMKELSDADGRITRRREIRAHLRSCADCRAFRDEIAERHEDLAALAPLPLAASAGLLHGVLGGKAGAGGAAAGGSLATTVGAGAGKTVATSAIVKSAATVAVVAAAGLSAADRGGLIDLPVPGERGHTLAPSPVEPDRPPGKASPIGGVDSAATSAAAAEQPSPGSTAGKPQSAGGGTGNDAQSEGANGGSSSGTQTTKRDATPSDSPSGSQSQSNLTPPGGGHGRSASKRHGPPEHLPEAAGHGQQTATAHKSPHAASPPGKSGSGGNHRKSSDVGGSPAVKPTPSPKAKGQSATSPPVEVPSQADNGRGASSQNTAPPEHAR